MAEVAPSAGGGGGNRNFLLIIGGLAALLFIGLLSLGAIFFLPGLLGGTTNLAGITPTPTRISIPPTNTRTPPPSPTLVVAQQTAAAPGATLEAGARLVNVELGANNSVTLTVTESGKVTLTQSGTWDFDQATGQLTVTFTELNGQPFEDVIVFELDGTQLKPIEYNKALHGDLQAIELKRANSGAPLNHLMPAQKNVGSARPAAQATATTEPITGDYTGTIPPPPPGVRAMALYLGANNTAVLSTVEAGQDSILQLGTWSADGNKVTVNLTSKNGQPFDEVLSLQLENNTLVGTTTDPALHGAALQFTVDPTAPPADAKLPAGTFAMTLALDATPIAITATPIMITATPGPGANNNANANNNNQLPDSGLGEDLLLLLGGGILLLGIIVVVRRMRAA